MPDTPTPLPLAAPALSRGLILLMATAAGASVANIYYAQPILTLIARSFNVPGGVAAQVTAATQIGYAAGLVLLVPLGDSVDRRRLILWQALALVAALAVATVAPSLPVLIGASLAVGAASSIAQQLIPIAAELALPETRGRTVGTVMSGLLSGILLARTLSGAVGSVAGWRATFAMGTVIAVLMALALWALLPSQAPRSSQGYGALLLSLGRVVRRYPKLRRAATVQGLLFGSFSAFWATLTLLLAGPDYRLGPLYAGLFGIVGLAGVAAAPLAGTLADRRGPTLVARVGICAVVACFALMAFVPGIAALVVGVLLLDAGTQLTNVSQQTIILALDDASRGRINTVYVTSIFIGGAAGSIGGSLAWSYAGWDGVCALGAALAIAALLVHRWGYAAAINAQASHEPSHD